MNETNAFADILLATYNGERFLREQLDSILKQDYHGWHLTVSDDRSTDGTEAILQEYAEANPQKMTIHRSGKRFGNARDHFLYLANQSTADYVFFCDQDDIWFDDKVGMLLKEIQKTEWESGKDIPILVFGDLIPVDENKETLADSLTAYEKLYTEQFDYRSILMQNVATGGSMLVNRALLELAGKYENKEELIMHDWWLAVVAARFGQIIYVNQPVGLYRQHDRNVIGARRVDSLSYVEKSMASLEAVRERIRRKKAQARAFLETYRDRLTEEDFLFLEGFEKPKSGLPFYMRYRKLVHSPFRFWGMVILG